MSAFCWGLKRTSGAHQRGAIERYAQLGIKAIPNWAFRRIIVSDDIDAEEVLFRERVRDAIQAGGKSGAMSRKTGIPVGTLNKYVALRSTPSATNALKIAKALGLTVEELAAGVELPALHEAQASSRVDPISPTIFRSVKKAVREINAHAGIRLPDDARDEEAIRWYNELIAMARGNLDEGKLRSLLPALEYEIGEAVKRAVAEPGAGKASA